MTANITVVPAMPNASVKMTAVVKALARQSPRHAARMSWVTQSTPLLPTSNAKATLRVSGARGHAREWPTRPHEPTRTRPASTSSYLSCNRRRNACRDLRSSAVDRVAPATAPCSAVLRCSRRNLLGPRASESAVRPDWKTWSDTRSTLSESATNTSTGTCSSRQYTQRRVVMVRDPHRSGVEIEAIVGTRSLGPSSSLTVPRRTVNTRPPGRARASSTWQS